VTEIRGLPRVEGLLPGLQLTADDWVRTGGRAPDPEVALVVRALLAQDGVLPALGQPGPVGFLVDRSIAEVLGGRDETLAHAGAVPGPVDEHHALERALEAQLVDLVVEDQLVAKSAGRELKVIRLGVGVGPVSGQEMRRMAPIVDAREGHRGVVSYPGPRLVERGHPDHQTWHLAGIARIVGTADHKGGLVAPDRELGLAVPVAQRHSLALGVLSRDRRGTRGGR
jgi:hypothetical protein